MAGNENSGRKPTGIEDWQIKKICQNIIQKSSYPLPAAMEEGVSERTFLRWKSFGIRDIEAGVDSPYSNFWRAIAHAESVSEATGSAALKILSFDKVEIKRTTVTKRDGSVVVTETPVLLRQGNANAAIALMEKRFRGRWGRFETIRHEDGVAKDDLEKIAAATGVSVEKLVEVFEKGEGRKPLILETPQQEMDETAKPN